MGSFAGYASARMYKALEGRLRQKCTLLTAFAYPGVCFSAFLLLDLLLYMYGSTGAVPALSIVSLLALWFGVSVPLVFLGAFFGYKQDPIKFPVITSNIPREIPLPQPWYLSLAFTTAVGGILPFGASFVELFFILSSMWMDQYYYVFGFTGLVFIILIVTCCQCARPGSLVCWCSADVCYQARSLLSCATSSSALKTITGGGDLS